MKVILKLPKLSMNMDEATLLEWYRSIGDSFKSGDVLYSLETEKVTSDVEAPCDGVLLEKLVAEGDNVVVGTAVCRIDKKD